ncbi:phosphate ABC transporter substrate-binding protein [Paenibacillus sediminis]|uniref:Phosphate-binding protein n=1 Tax=Paenibacillus sediminis TaxID=664909 RepID=A0ABS4H3V5_9BACL|nr:phosphate ABC transporter substrate-binding protein [Paenibacillus sediminis]MBP1937218.1 phosphate transport system substrate-binding protein [Paenibacillus sediminis]
MKKTMMLILAAVLTLALAACGKNSGGSAEGGDQSSANTNSELTGSILATGSSALQPLVEEASKTFMDKNKGITVQVQGGGSGTGLTQVAGGQADIGNSDVFASEKLDAAQAKDLVDHQVAVVGMAAVVNPKVNIDNLTKQQLVDIFTGKVTNWKELGGPDQKIQIVNRPASSGTRATFEKYALGMKTEDLQGSIQEDSSGTVKKLIAETPGAIGYLALSYIDDSVKAVKYEGVAPTEDNVANGTYPIWAYEHMYTKGEPKPEVKAFLDYMTSDEVQNGAVKDLGYIPVSKMQVVRDVDGNIKKK